MEGKKVVISFRHTGSGLMMKGSKLEGFVMAGVDKIFHWAEATIKNNEVIVWCQKVAEPVAVRYAWANNPKATLYNKEGYQLLRSY